MSGIHLYARISREKTLSLFLSLLVVSSLIQKKNVSKKRIPLFFAHYIDLDSNMSDENEYFKMNSLVKNIMDIHSYRFFFDYLIKSRDSVRSICHCFQSLIFHGLLCFVKVNRSVEQSSSLIDH